MFELYGKKDMKRMVKMNGKEYLNFKIVTVIHRFVNGDMRIGIPRNLSIDLKAEKSFVRKMITIINNVSRPLIL